MNWLTSWNGIPISTLSTILRYSQIKSWVHISKCHITKRRVNVNVTRHLRRGTLARHVSYYYYFSSPPAASLTQLGSFPRVSRAQGQVTLFRELPASSHVTFCELPL